MGYIFSGDTGEELYSSARIKTLFAIAFRVLGRAGRRSLTRTEVFVLSWLIFNSKDRDYRQMMSECKLSLEQCETAIRALMELDLLHLS